MIPFWWCLTINSLRFTLRCTNFGRISGIQQGCDTRSMETDRTAELFRRPHPTRLKTKRWGPMSRFWTRRRAPEPEDVLPLGGAPPSSPLRDPRTLAAEAVHGQFAYWEVSKQVFCAKKRSCKSVWHNLANFLWKIYTFIYWLRTQRHIISKQVKIVPHFLLALKSRSFG